MVLTPPSLRAVQRERQGAEGKDKVISMLVVVVVVVATAAATAAAALAVVAVGLVPVASIAYGPWVCPFPIGSFSIIVIALSSYLGRAEQEKNFNLEEERRRCDAVDVCSVRLVTSRTRTRTTTTLFCSVSVSETRCRY